MKKCLITLILGLFTMLALSGCIPSYYSAEWAEKISSQGGIKIREYLNEQGIEYNKLDVHMQEAYEFADGSDMGHFSMFATRIAAGSFVEGETEYRIYYDLETDTIYTDYYIERLLFDAVKEELGELLTENSSAADFEIVSMEYSGRIDYVSTNVEFLKTSSKNVKQVDTSGGLFDVIDGKYNSPETMREYVKDLSENSKRKEFDPDKLAEGTVITSAMTRPSNFICNIYYAADEERAVETTLFSELDKRIMFGAMNIVRLSDEDMAYYRENGSLPDYYCFTRLEEYYYSPEEQVEHVIFDTDIQEGVGVNYVSGYAVLRADDSYIPVVYRTPKSPIILEQQKIKISNVTHGENHAYFFFTEDYTDDKAIIRVNGNENASEYSLTDYGNGYRGVQIEQATADNPREAAIMYVGGETEILFRTEVKEETEETMEEEDVSEEEAETVTE